MKHLAHRPGVAKSRDRQHRAAAGTPVIGSSCWSAQSCWAARSVMVTTPMAWAWVMPSSAATTSAACRSASVSGPSASPIRTVSARNHSRASGVSCRATWPSASRRLAAAGRYRRPGNCPGSRGRRPPGWRPRPAAAPPGGPDGQPGARTASESQPRLASSGAQSASPPHGSPSEHRELRPHPGTAPVASYCAVTANWCTCETAPGRLTTRARPDNARECG